MYKKDREEGSKIDLAVTTEKGGVRDAERKKAFGRDGRRRTLERTKAGRLAEEGEIRCKGEGAERTDPQPRVACGG